MAPKRKNEDRETNIESNNATGGQRKKKRLDEARNISVQVALPGPSKAVENANASSMEAMPSTIDVEKFAESRAFEIDAMQNAMDNAAAGGTQRVWQTLPRHLRRRAASHDVRRVPARLRQKARAEMDSPAKPGSKKKLPKRGKEKTITRTEDFLRRQEDKTWLETHIWHAKRMHMENMWGYRLARTPTEKSFRPSHRASLHGCILHDASYEAIVELKGPEEVVKGIVASFSDPQAVGPGAVRFTNGSRVCYTHMYKPNSYPFDLIGPVEILWKTASVSMPSPVQVQSRPTKTKGKRRQAPPKDAVHRALWIRCHPLIYDAVISTIKYSVQACLQLAQSSSERETEVEVADLRDQFNIFELVGPKSSQVIHGALTPVKDDDRDEFKKFWKALGQLQTAGSAPRGMVIGFKVLDPRLNFPPKNTKVALNGKANAGVSVPEGLWPTAKLATAEIWNNEIRANLSKPRFKKMDIDSRKSKHLVLGSKLNPLRQDNRVPVLLIQRSIEAEGAVTPLHASSNSTRPLHGWTLIVPKGWAMPFFSSLTHTGTRVGGQRECATQRFEAGCTGFPTDYPCTEGYATYTAERGREERERWERKPPAKRPNWESLGTENPWVPDWEALVGLRKAHAKEDANLVTTQREAPETLTEIEGEDADAREKDVGEERANVPDIRPWLFRGQEVLPVIEFISHSPNPASDLLVKFNTWRAKRAVPALLLAENALLRGALVSVRLSIPRSGSPEDNAAIYKMDDEEARKWRPLVESEEGEFTETQLSELKSPKDAIVGYVTSGHYSLSIGRGQAVGALSLVSYLEMREQLHRLGKVRSLPLVKIRNKDSSICRAALVELVC